MKNFIVLLLLIPLFSCENDEGKVLAQKYCKCVMNARGDIYSVGECEEEFKEDIEAIEKQPRLYNDFMNEIEKCQ